MPDEFQPVALEQFGRVLKPGGNSWLLEMVYPKRQEKQNAAWNYLHLAWKRSMTADLTEKPLSTSKRRLNLTASAGIY
jgi:ubiquinone/menaquinone biosynthesis C-methylase UbiE